MTHKTVPITLLSTVSESSCRSIYKQLKCLGYTNIDAIACTEFPVTDSGADSIYVLPLNSDWQAALPAGILSVLHRIHHKPVLGVIPPSSQRWEREILRFCNEFLYWPCTKKEIELRLERLAHLLPNGSGREAESRIRDEFFSLNMVGSSPAFLHVLRQIKKIARCEAPVLIVGESGTGKELTARAIHYLGVRRDYPFIPVNCGAIPDSLLENELFGHRQGAFTDAKTSQEGLVCQAEEGTLFLDEVETFSPKGQVVLLRFLQDQRYKSLGSNRHRQADVRIIAASNARLQELVEQGAFRKDLFYRLNIIPISLPPLSQRGDDILELAGYFLNKFRIQYNQPEKQLDQESIDWLRHYNWPGNVRELENLLHREFLLAEGPGIRLGPVFSMGRKPHFSGMEFRQDSFLNSNMQEAKAEAVRRFEIDYLTRLLNETDGNVTRAARKAGKERRSLGKLIKKHGIDKAFLNRS